MRKNGYVTILHSTKDKVLILADHTKKFVFVQQRVQFKKKRDDAFLLQSNLSFL